MKKYLHAIQPYTKMIALLMMIGLSFVYAMFQGGFVSWFLFYCFLPFGIYAILLFFYSLRDFRVQRIITASSYQAGDDVSIKLELSRRFSFPLHYLVVEDILPEKLAKYSTVTTKKLVFPGFRKSIKLDYHINNLVRGEHVFKNVVIKTGDMLGLFQKSYVMKFEGKLLVIPKYNDLRFKQMVAFYEQGQTASVVKMRRDTSIVSGIRDYQPGDRLGWIDWKATAKRNEIMTKEFEERKSQDVFVILDQFPSETFEELVSLTASLAHSIIKRGVQVGFTGTNDLNEMLLIRGGDAQKQKILYQLAKVEDNTKTTLEMVLKGSDQYLPSNLSFLMVTSHFTEETLRALSNFKRNRPAAIFVVKKDHSNKESEVKLEEMARVRGITLKFLAEGEWELALAEVGRR
ncbi:DUF58 domain-containing protein [Peribacillus alkalitolerans]|uniref:DUF58 domain-containing protein n=1 Tax=Peribacillus alkalitolerans TaxID=1550385 RepID=UPI0013D691B8|nr:DUF58 domain-containing protein [Peribacillus alkalitolerans]